MSLEFPPDVVEDAVRSVRAPRLPGADETAIPFVTIDPPESLDLDQALHIERRGTWYRVRYAIADVAAFVTPGGPMDREAHVRARRCTRRTPTPAFTRRSSPRAAAASSPRDATRSSGRWMSTRRARKSRSRYGARCPEPGEARLRGRARSLDDGTADESLRLLAEVGLLRQKREVRRGGINLPIPEQTVERGRDGYELSFRAPLPVEGWNAQISLMAGQAAAELMSRRTSGCCAPCRKPTRGRSPGFGGWRKHWASSGAGAFRTPTSFAPWIRTSPHRPQCCRSRPCCCAAPAMRRSTTRCRRRRRTPASAPRTRTRRLRCAGSSTATWARCAYRSPRATTCLSGRARRSPIFPRRWRRRTGRATVRGGDRLDGRSGRARAQRGGRLRGRRGRPPRASRRRHRAASRPGCHRPLRRRRPAAWELVEVRLELADVAKRQVRFTLAR